MTDIPHESPESEDSRFTDLAYHLIRQEDDLRSIREALEGHQEPGEFIPGVNREVEQAEQDIIRLERDLLERKKFLVEKIREKIDLNTRLAEGQRNLAKLLREHADMITKALLSIRLP